MSITVVGSVAYDTVTTLFGKSERQLGGSAIYFSLAASKFTNVIPVGVYGEDFLDEDIEILKNNFVDTSNLLKEKGLTDAQIAATFPQGVEDDVFEELSINLEGLLTGLTPELLQSGQADKRKDAVAGEAAINKELRRLRSIGISAKYDRKNNQIVINKLGGKDDEGAPIDLEGKTLTLYLNEIKLYS